MIRRQLCPECTDGVSSLPLTQVCEECGGTGYVFRCAVCGDTHDEELLRDLHDLRTLDVPACLPCTCETDAAAAIRIVLSPSCWHCRKPGCRRCPSSGNCARLGCEAPGCRREEGVAAE